jgi:hypothetical protein
MKKLLTFSLFLFFYTMAFGQITIVPSYFCAYGNIHTEVTIRGDVDKFVEFSMFGESTDNGLGRQMTANESRVKGFQSFIGRSLLVNLKTSGFQVAPNATINIVPISVDDVSLGLTASQVLEKRSKNNNNKLYKIQNLQISIDSLTASWKQYQIPIFDTTAQISQIAVLVSSGEEAESPFFMTVVLDADSVQLVQNNGTVVMLTSFEEVIIVTDVPRGTVPKEFSLSQNYPNPFNPSTTINFSISQTEKVNLKIYDVLGREVATLVNEQKAPGNYEVKFNAGNFASGMYLYRLQAGDFVQTKKMILMK